MEEPEVKLKSSNEFQGKITNSGWIKKIILGPLTEEIYYFLL